MSAVGEVGEVGGEVGEVGEVKLHGPAGLMS